MSLANEWNALRRSAESALDDLAHIEVLAVATRPGRQPRAVVTRIELGGDVELYVGVDTPAALLRLSAVAMTAASQIYAGRIDFVTGIVSAAL